MRCLISRIAPLMAVFGIVLSVGCSSPAVVEGVVASESYVIQDNSPSLRMAGDTMHIVLNEEDGQWLRVVNLELSNLDALPLGQAVEMTSEEGPARVTVSQGELVVIERSDGARIISSENNTFYEVKTGALTIYDRDEVVNGEFSLELADGGHLEGSFSLTRP